MYNRHRIIQSSWLNSYNSHRSSKNWTFHVYTGYRTISDVSLAVTISFLHTSLWNDLFSDEHLAEKQTNTDGSTQINDGPSWHLHWPISILTESHGFFHSSRWVVANEKKSNWVPPTVLNVNPKMHCPLESCNATDSQPDGEIFSS